MVLIKWIDDTDWRLRRMNIDHLNEVGLRSQSGGSNLIEEVHCKCVGRKYEKNLWMGLCPVCNQRRKLAIDFFKKCIAQLSQNTVCSWTRLFKSTIDNDTSEIIRLLFTFHKVRANSYDAFLVKLQGVHLPLWTQSFQSAVREVCVRSKDKG